MSGDDEWEDGEITEGGSRIIMPTRDPEAFVPPQDYAENCDLITEHLESVLGPCENVLHEILSSHVHLDVLIFPPTEDRDFWVYSTSGMGDLRMELPEGLDPVEYGRAELMIALPRAWGDRLSQQMSVSDDDDAFWPIGLLKQLARYPHEVGTWFAHMHTIPSFDGEPYAKDSALDGVMLTYSLFLPQDKWELTLPDGDVLNFYGLTLLHPDEMAFKLEHGAEELLDLLDRADVSPVVDIHRPSVLASRKRRGLLGWLRRQ